MRNYHAGAGTQVRIDYGIALYCGLDNFEKTRPYAPAFKELNDRLEAQFKARLDLRKPWLIARQRVRFEDLNVDELLRSFQAAAKIADGGRVGPISKAVLRGGLTVAIAPSGASQLPALNRVIDDLLNARVEGIEAFRAEQLPKLEAARNRLESAVAEFQAARDAYYAAFAVEKAMRDEHRLAIDALMGTVRSLFPGDKRRQDTVFPEVAVARGRAAADESDEDGDEE